MENSGDIHVYGHGRLEANMRIFGSQHFRMGGGGDAIKKIVSLKFVIDSFQLNVIVVNLKNMDEQKS